MILLESCPVCHAGESVPWCRLQDVMTAVDAEYALFRCPRCGLIYLNPQVEMQELIRDFNYTRLAAETATAAETRAMIHTEKNAYKLALIRRHRETGPGALLDIGCNRGEFLAYMQERGWEVVGTELHQDYQQPCAVPIRYGADALQRLIAEKRSFDVITLWAVLQHVYDPAAIMADCRRLLRPGGLVFILISNADSPAAGRLKNIDVPRLLYLFDRRNASRFLADQGFETIAVDFRASSRIFSSTARGLLLYYFRRYIAGMKEEEIIRAYRDRQDPERYWKKDARGRVSPVLRAVNCLDKALSAGLLDPLLLALGKGSVMTLVGRRQP